MSVVYLYLPGRTPFLFYLNHLNNGDDSTRTTSMVAPWRVIQVKNYLFVDGEILRNEYNLLEITCFHIRVKSWLHMVYDPKSTLRGYG
jgi:hypothetical protein